MDNYESPDTSGGLFMSKINWTDPRFAPWKISQLDLNQEQLDAFFDDESIDFPDLTEEQLKEICLKVPCGVDLDHSNVCGGVERNWPKKMYKESHFNNLRPKQKQKIYAKMERNGVILYNKYVNEERLAKIRYQRSSRALAPFYEEIYRKNLFLRLKALAESSDDDGVQNESSDASESDVNLSMQTVINTGTLRESQQSNQSNAQKSTCDYNDNNSYIANNENVGNTVEIESNIESDCDSAMSLHLDNWQSVQAYINIENDSVHKIEVSDDEYVNICDDSEHSDAFNDHFSESIVSSSVQESDLSQAVSQSRAECATPLILSNEIVMDTPALSNLHPHLADLIADAGSDSDSDDDEIDSIDFLSQRMVGFTSTQQSQMA